MSNQNGGILLSMILIMSSAVVVAGLVVVDIATVGVSRKHKETILKMEVLQEAVEAYQEDNATVAPTDLDDLVFDYSAVACYELCNGCVACTACAIDNVSANASYLSLQGWCGPYIDQKLQNNFTDFKTDAWGTEFEYDDAGPIVIRSWGPNLTDNGGGSDDITISF